MQTNNFTSNSLLILTWNSNGLINRRNELLATLQNSRIDIALISETHLTNITQINLPGYHIIKSNHPDGTAHAGAAIFIRTPLLFYPLPQYQTAHKQACGIAIILNNIPINIYAIYSAPRHSITPTLFQHFFSTLDQRFIIGGDLNAKNIQWGCRTNNPRGNTLYNLSQQNNYKIQALPSPTYWPTSLRKRPDILDIFVTKIPNSLHNTLTDLNDLCSDHSAVLLTIDTAASKKPNKPSLTQSCMDWEAFRTQLVNRRHCLSFRGHREGNQSDNRGNFKDLAALLAKYSPALASHITEVEIKGRTTHYFLSWQRQNQLIHAVSINICHTIQEELLSATYFSVSLDTTFDVSRVEQLSIVFRYINKGIVYERLVAVRATLLATGQHIFTMFKDICEEMKINWKEHLVGQSFDGAASMRGTYNGLQAFIREQNQSAIYVWCYAHRFSLVIVDAVSSCLEARDLFGNLEVLYDFLGSSKKQIGLFSNFQKNRYPGKPQRRLKRVTTTRWSSHSSALLTVLDTFDALIDTLDDLQNDPTTDRVCCVKASGLMDYLLSERFVLTSLLFINIYNITSPLSKFLQSENADLLAAVNYVKDVLIKIEDLRSENEFNELQNNKNKFIESKKNDFSFTSLKEIKRIRRIKQMSGELALDESISNPLNLFKVNTYIIIIDIIMTQIKECFNEGSTPLLKDFSLFQRRRIKEIAEDNLSMPLDAFDGLEAFYGKFISAKNLKREYLQFANIFFNFETLTKLPKQIHDDVDSILHRPR